jgi:hypothetical protein
MPGRGLEPLRISPPDPKSGASANFATLAHWLPISDISAGNREVNSDRQVSPQHRNAVDPGALDKLSQRKVEILDNKTPVSLRFGQR